MNAAPTPTPDQFDQPASGQYSNPSTGQYGAPQSYSNQNHYSQRTEEDPGKVLGIVSLVATVVGIITGHMARKRSQEAGYGNNEMAKWGFILGLVFLGLLVIGWALGISFGIVGGLASLMAG